MPGLHSSSKQGNGRGRGMGGDVEPPTLSPSSPQSNPRFKTSSPVPELGVDSLVSFPLVHPALHSSLARFFVCPVHSFLSLSLIPLRLVKDRSFLVQPPRAGPRQFFFPESRYILLSPLPEHRQFEPNSVKKAEKEEKRKRKRVIYRIFNLRRILISSLPHKNPQRQNEVLRSSVSRRCPPGSG